MLKRKVDRHPSIRSVAGGVAIAFGFEKRPGLVLRTELFIPVED